MDESFAERWKRKEHESGFGDIAAKMVACGPDELPESAAPSLSFERAARPVPIWEVFASPSDWPAADCERVAAYRMIGSDGAGNPICIEQRTGAIILLDHEDRFRTRQFVNSSVRQLAECLLAYMGNQDPEQFRAAVLAIDPTAMADWSFWWHEAAMIGA